MINRVLMEIPLVDLKRQYDTIKDEINAAIQQVISSSSFILGENVMEFEKKFARFCSTKYCVGVSSGTDSLYLALRALDVGHGDEVITACNTFIATALAISKCGAKPVLIDCCKTDYNIDPAKIEEAITDKTKAIIPVHMYGQPADMSSILKISNKYGIEVVEDASQAHGAKYKKRKAGGIANIGCFSFYPSKNLGAYGDAGAITTNNYGIYEKIKLLRDYGQEKKYSHIIKGTNSRLDSLQAAILNVKLKHLDKWNAQRRRNAKLYERFLEAAAWITIPIERDDVEHVYCLYVIMTKLRDKLLTELKSKNIAAGIHYPIPIHLQQAYTDLGYKNGSFPVAEKCADQILSLPMFPELTEKEIRYVAEAIKNAKSHCGNSSL